MYDLIIIGGGPAGVGAGVYAARKQLKTALLTAAMPNQLPFGGQSVVSTDVQNWIGTPSVTGVELAAMLEKHLRTYAGEFIEIKASERVTKVEKRENDFAVLTEKSSYEARTVLITTGSARRRLTVPGADRFEHKGITYCASCDGPLFAGKDVAVVGGGNAGFETAAQLLAYAKSVTLLDYSPQFKADPVTVKAVLKDPKMKAISNAELLEVKGEQFVTSLIYKDRSSDEVREHPTQGIFVEIGLVPTTNFVEGLLALNQYNQIEIDPWTQRTSVEGLWAAGDCTNVRYHQNNIAVGDAVRALEDIYVYLRAR
ncbi:MAG: FAD-dependent oxidoreductase [bacterium]|nr:FAD-dependent oxidoreductase [bacterium]MDZ4284613.1 FAD-dependent oxidoreductase [Patescibacteria group bacterium]